MKRFVFGFLAIFAAILVSPFAAAAFVLELFAFLFALLFVAAGKFVNFVAVPFNVVAKFFGFQFDKFNTANKPKPWAITFFNFRNFTSFDGPIRNFFGFLQFVFTPRFGTRFGIE